ncbi:MAG: ACT domain-containing protein [Pseudomonadota bacterium]
MNDPVKSGKEMIAFMSPREVPGTFVFVSVPDTAHASALSEQALALFREPEGPSLVLPVAAAEAAGLPYDLPMACITLTVHSALDGVGLTAAVSQALAERDIPCNIVAAFHHDHVFVPRDQAELAMETLLKLQRNTASRT